VTDISMTQNRSTRSTMTLNGEYSISGYPQYIIATIIEVKSVIDQYYTNFKNAKGLTLRLAKNLDKEELCEKNQICRKIKEILNDKIKEGKISEKWIEECLPRDYKRKYTKSELTSLSKREKNLGKIDVDNFGKAMLTEISSKKGESNNNCSPSKENFMVLESTTQNSKRPVISCTRCKELEEALLMASPATSAIDLSRAEISFAISKEKYQEVLGAILCDYDCFHLVFNRFNGSLLRIEVPDIRQSDQGC
jgi:hypothetical protein